MDDRARGALDGVAPIEAAGVTVSVTPRFDRAVLRGDAAAFGVGLPDQVGSVAERDAGAVLCLGPDEWLALAIPGGAVLRVAGAGAAVDVGHRQTALDITGRLAAALLNAGCPLDLHVTAFPPGSCTRTVCGKAEIVLWRRAAERFHVEVARSYAAYLWAFLAENARGLR